MADADKFPGIAFIAIIDGSLAFILFIILFNISIFCWAFEYWWLTLLQMAFIFVSTIGTLAAVLGSHRFLLNYFLIKLLLTLVFTIFVVASWKVGAGNWAQLNYYLRKTAFCQDELSATTSNPIFNACCKEPVSCNSSSLKNSSFHNPSCHWSTDSTILCYECQSCQDAVLASFRMSGKTSAILSTTFLGIFLSFYITQIYLYWKGTKRNSTRVAPSSDQV